MSATGPAASRGLARAAPSPGEAVATAPALRLALSRQEAESTGALLRVVSDASRLQLLSLIHNSRDGEARVADLARALDLRSPTVSYHLRMLGEAGVVSRDPRGRDVWYSIVPQRLASIADLLR
ncbi:MAG: metalloregulator ArsR/SmtB family transcription factor [Propionibacterium sp.]|nr:metalloregulator ArsR/SmtB family transcription factor [Propionibacterium sp.]